MTKQDTNYLSGPGAACSRVGRSVLLMAALAFCGHGYAESQGKPVKLLTIGNSFAYNSITYLQEIAEGEGREIPIFPAVLPGAPMARHVFSIEAYEEDPESKEARPYPFYKDSETGEEQRYSLREALELEEWDFVTIQQLSRQSLRPETFEPYVKTLVEYVREHAPNAEVLVHMTWTYRADHEWYTAGEVSREAMYEGLREAYTDMAERYNLRIAPVGIAFENARTMDEWQFDLSDPDFDYENPEVDTIPDESGSIMRDWGWSVDQDTGTYSTSFDVTHAGAPARYLGGLVLYATLFDADPTEVDFAPSELSEDEADSLRRAARQAVEEFEDFNAKRERSSAAR